MSAAEAQKRTANVAAQGTVARMRTASSFAPSRTLLSLWSSSGLQALSTGDGLMTRTPKDLQVHTLRGRSDSKVSARPQQRPARQPARAPNLTACSRTDTQAATPFGSLPCRPLKSESCEQAPVS